MPTNYTLGPRFEEFIRGLVESGRYSSAREILQDGLRLLEDRERLLEVKLGELRSQVEEGRASSLSEQDGEAFLDQLEAKYRAVAASRG